jgi:hypothetical protein
MVRDEYTYKTRWQNTQDLFTIGAILAHLKKKRWKKTENFEKLDLRLILIVNEIDVYGKWATNDSLFLCGGQTLPCALSYCTMRMPPCRACCCTFKPQWTGSWNRNKIPEPPLWLSWYFENCLKTWAEELNGSLRIIIRHYFVRLETGQ